MIRTCTPKDKDVIYDLLCELEEMVINRQGFDEIYDEQLKGTNRTLLAYVDENDKPVGFLNLRIEHQLHHGEFVAEPVELVVTNEYRDKGVGGELFQKACDIARQKGCRTLELTTNQLRLGAQRFYERQGMRKTHYKLTMNLYGETPTENKIGR